MLAEIYKDLAENHLRDAQAKADALVEAYPTFRLGHLVRGDLLLMHTRPVVNLGAPALNKEAESRLQDLRREAAARLRAEARPAGELQPRALLQLRKDQRHALIVDARRSRVYLYENRNGDIRYVSDYYFSQGKLGVNKVKEGDMRTPVGVYYISGRLSGARLPDFYGKGALPLDYPNSWDKLNGRSGSGIWIHGVPPETFSRAPLSTDGCVVVSNDDLQKLSRIVEVGKTPILIGDQVEFVKPSVRENDRKLADSLLEGWRRDAERRDSDQLRTHYSARFKSINDEKADAWITRQQFLPGAKRVHVALQDTSHFRQPSQEDIIISTFTQQTAVGKFHHTVRLRQYWAREGNEWKIVSESVL
ncbi:murein L,D-transpeptidase family protein [Pseudoduganella sp. UC29_71]|uniref:L,D-transpeptidase family protein n=1 Tax=Pseudoduganella sp. UC29_71 TaxID=3350174 RepID=UPI00366B03FA